MTCLFQQPHIVVHSYKQSNTIPKITNKMVESAWASIGYFLHHLDPDIRRIASRLKRLHLKILKKKQS